MERQRVSAVVQQLCAAVRLRQAAELTDGQLLECFVAGGEPAALEALVHRHGAMVWSVCRRILPHHYDAEDAFQATFLVLVRRADSVRPRELVANWLYGVAHRTALKARATAAKRRAREPQMIEVPEPSPASPDVWKDVQPLLDQELSRLPDKYRVAMVLCDLEGKTGREAARQLGVPEGTVASRLARARALLAKRLTQRGVTLSGGALAAVLAQSTAAACVPPLVVSSTVNALTLAAAGQAATLGMRSAAVAALTDEVVKAMLLTKIKSAVAALFVLTATVAVAGLLYHVVAAERAMPTSEREWAAQHPAKPRREDTVRNELGKLQGTWIAVAYESRGEQRSEEQLKQRPIRLTIAGDQFSITRAGQEESMRGKLVIDATQQPKTMDWLSVTAGEKELGDVKGIYELAGDTLKHCYGETDRPTEFKTKPTADVPKFYVWKRETDGVAQATPKDRQPDAPGSAVSRIDQLLQARLTALKAIAAETEKEFNQTGRIPPETVLEAKLAVLRAELELCKSAKERIGIHEKMVALAKEIEDIVDARFKAGRVQSVDLFKARINRLDAEIAQEREKATAAEQRK